MLLPTGAHVLHHQPCVIGESSLVLQIQEDLQYRNVANILRGAVQVGHPISQGTMGRLVKAAVADIESADPNTVSHMLVALAKMSTEDSLRDRLVLTSLRKVHPGRLCSMWMLSTKTLIDNIWLAQQFVARCVALDNIGD